MIAILGESASGKSTVEKVLVNNYGYKKLVTYTTRAMRDGEEDGVDYNFVSKGMFENLKQKGFFAESNQYNGWYYGTAKKHCTDDKVVVLTPAGFRALKKNKDLNIASFYINVPRRDRLIKILQRGDKIEEAVRRNISDVGQYDGIGNEVDFVIANPEYKITPEQIADKIMHLMNGGLDKKKTIFCDMDCTLFNTIAAIVFLYDEDFKYYSDYEKVHWIDVKSWDFAELKVATKEQINTYFNTQRFFDTVEMYANAKEVLDELSKEYNIVFVSHGFSPNLRAKEVWIKEHFPYAKFIGVNLKEHKDKSCVDMNGGIFIDDRADNLKSSNAEVKVCFGDDYKWNEDFNSDRKNHFRTYNWTDVKNLLLKTN